MQALAVPSKEASDCVPTDNHVFGGACTIGPTYNKDSLFSGIGLFGYPKREEDKSMDKSPANTDDWCQSRMHPYDETQFSVTKRSMTNNEEIWNPEHPMYATLDARLASFKNWPKQMCQRPVELARNGFFWGEKGDLVICNYCGCRLKHWEAEDKADVEHLKWNSRCRFAGAQKVNSDISYFNRLITFRSWPPQIKQKSADLCRSGFFYTKQNDTVKCINCNVELRCWHEWDDINRRHLTNSPKCDVARSVQ